MRWFRNLSGRSARILAWLLLLAFVLDFLFYSGFYSSDDREYLSGARALTGDEVFYAGLGSSRFGLTVPAALVYWLTKSIAAIAWFHCVYHLALVVMAFVLGRLLHGERSGLFAAAFVAMNPLLYGYAGAVLPDNATAMWIAASMIAMTLAQQRYPTSTPESARLLAWNRRRATTYFIAGAFLGIGYLCKETALIMTIPAAVYIIAASPRLRDLGWMQNGAFLALGLVAVLVLDAIALRYMTGEWVSRLEMVADSDEIFIQRMSVQGETPFSRIDFAIERLELWIPITMWVLAIGSVAYGFLRDRRIGLMTFFWWPLIFLTVGSTSLTEYLPPSIQSRYYAIVMLPASIMLAVVANKLIDRWQASERAPTWSRGRVPLAVITFAIAVWGWSEFREVLPRAGGIYRAATVRAFVAALDIARDEYPNHPIMLSKEYWRRMHPLMWNRPSSSKIVSEYQRPDPPYLLLSTVAGIEEELALLPSDESGWMLARIDPPPSRTDVLLDAGRRMVSVGRKPKMEIEPIRSRSAAILLITRKTAKPTAPPKTSR